MQIIFYICVSILITNIMDKLSLTGTQLYLSLLACDPSKPIYKVSASKGEYRDEFFTNQPQFYPGYDFITYDLLDKTEIRNSLFFVPLRFNCDSSLMYHHFMTLYNEYTKKTTETEK